MSDRISVSRETLQKARALCLRVQGYLRPLEPGFDCDVELDRQATEVLEELAAIELLANHRASERKKR